MNGLLILYPHNFTLPGVSVIHPESIVKGNRKTFQIGRSCKVSIAIIEHLIYLTVVKLVIIYYLRKSNIIMTFKLIQILSFRFLYHKQSEH